MTFHPTLSGLQGLLAPELPPITSRTPLLARGVSI